MNYGHTFGHVIENETNYTTYLHGESVAIGMVMANRLAMRLGKMDASEADKIKSLLQKYDLPVEYKIGDTKRFYETFFLDKKSGDSSITFIVPVHIGGVEITDDIPKADVMAVLESFAGAEE